MVALGFAVGWTLSGCSSAFSCQEDSQCEQNGQAGVCQPATGFCSFPSDDCESGQQYGGLAPDGIAGTCVPTTYETDAPGSTSTTSGGSSTSSGEATSIPRDTSTSGTPDSTDASEDATTEEESSGGTGDAPRCCGADCPDACAERARCPVELVGTNPPQNSEAVDVAVIGDSVVWSTGFGGSLMLADPDAGIDAELVSISDGSGDSYVTRLATDDTHVYFLDWGGPAVLRASVPGGVVESVTTVPGGQAGFGGIAVDDTHVYFAMRTTGGVWRATKGSGSSAELVAMADQPFGVAVDGEHLFYIDTVVGAVLRLALDSLDKGGASPDTVVTARELTAIAIDDEFLYYGASGSLGRADKLGTNEGIEILSAELDDIWNVDVDDTHVYVTLASGGEVGRIPKDGSEPFAVLANTEEPWGLALGCDDVYWADNGSRTLQRRRK